MLGRAVVYPGSKGRMWSKKKYSAAGVGVVVGQCAVTVDKKKYSFVMYKKVLMIGWKMIIEAESRRIEKIWKKNGNEFVALIFVVLLYLLIPNMKINDYLKIKSI